MTSRRQKGAYCDDCGKPTPVSWHYGHACEARVTDAELDERIAHYQIASGRAASDASAAARASLRYAIAWRKMREEEQATRAAPGRL